MGLHRELEKRDFRPLQDRADLVSGARERIFALFGDIPNQVAELGRRISSNLQIPAIRFSAIDQIFSVLASLPVDSKIDQISPNAPESRDFVFQENMILTFEEIRDDTGATRQNTDRTAHGVAPSPWVKVGTIAALLAALGTLLPLPW